MYVVPFVTYCSTAVTMSLGRECGGTLLMVAPRLMI